MNLFHCILERFSNYDGEELIRHMDRSLAPDILDRAVKGGVAASLTKFARMDRVIERTRMLSTRLGAKPNPEVFIAINRLMYASTVEEAWRAIGLLELHLGLVELNEVANPDNKIYRLLHSHNIIIRMHEGQVESLPESFDIGPWGTHLLFPVRGLFDDILPPELYGSVNRTPDRESIRKYLISAFSYLSKYAGEYQDDFSHAISNIVVLPSGAAQNTSFSWRLNYFGGIFVDAVDLSQERLAESLIHEYLHNRLWQWWSYEEPEGWPSAQYLICSPMTGKERPARTMLQALIIYAAVIEMYGFAIADSTSGFNAQARYEYLRKGLPILAIELLRACRPRSLAVEMIDFLLQEYL